MSRSLRTLLRVAPLLLASAPFADDAFAQAHAGPPAVGVIEVHRAPVVETSEYVGRVQAVDSVALVARVTGFLEQRLFDEGSEVKKGQLLYVIEQPPFQAQVEADQGTLQQAANLKTAQINLDYTSIRAPVDGRITSTSVNQGNVVGPTTGTLATIVTQDPMYVVFPVSERDLFQLAAKYGKTGGLGSLKIKLKLNTGAIYDQDGKLDYVSPVVSNSTDTVDVRATVANPKRGDTGANAGGTGQRQLVSGEFETVQLEAPQPISLITIPQSAVLSDQQGSYVFVVDGSDVAHRTNIHTGEQSGTNVAVLSGLPEGATVIVDGIQRAHDGGKVAPGAPQGQTVGSPTSVTTPHEQAKENTGHITQPGGAGNGSGAAGR